MTEQKKIVINLGYGVVGERSLRHTDALSNPVNYAE